MQLKDLAIGKSFRIIGGSSKIYRKLSNNGEITEYNECVCESDFKPDQKRGLMLVSNSYNHKINKHAQVVEI